MLRAGRDTIAWVSTPVAGASPRVEPYARVATTRRSVGGRYYGAGMAEEKRFQVFVSSTYLDLAEERRAVVETLLEVDAFPAGMELFPATDDDAWTLIESVIGDSDYYLLIVGGKYGSIDPDLDVSYTEREYDSALSLGKPVMAFLHGKPDHLTVEMSETDSDRRAKLAAFRDKVETAKHVKYWTSAEDLAGKVARTWVQFVKRYPAIGWIRADQASGRDTLEALAGARAEIEQLKISLERVRVEAPPGTEHLAQGESKVSIPISAKGRWTAEEYRWNDITVWLSVEMTWDRIFGFLGLSMMQEAEARRLHSDICRLIEMDHWAEIEEAFKVRVDDFTGELDAPAATNVQIELPDADVDNEHFQNILLQFRALGLIQHARRQRSVHDKGEYWGLTPFGQTRLDEIRALKVGETVLESDDQSADDEESGESDPDSGMD